MSGTAGFDIMSVTRIVLNDPGRATRPYFVIFLVNRDFGLWPSLATTLNWATFCEIHALSFLFCSSLDVRLLNCLQRQFSGNSLGSGEV